MLAFDLLRDRLPPPSRGELRTIQRLVTGLSGSLDWSAAKNLAGPWLNAVRDNPAPLWAMDSLLHEYPLSDPEGLALMRLAEALLRVPDAATALALTAEQLRSARFDAHSADATQHPVFAQVAARIFALSRHLLPDSFADANVLQRLGAKAVLEAAARALQVLGRQFVLGRSISEALSEAATSRKRSPDLRFSYDMLGEGARTELDARRHFASYLGAINAIAARNRNLGPRRDDGISIKLSALYSRYEPLHRDSVQVHLLPRAAALVSAAAKADINLTIDAEESDRLELSLDVFEVLAKYVANTSPEWQGLGLAIQAYQTRAPETIDEVVRIARTLGLRFAVRLVKGAYWDGEIKRAQELGLAGYPVYTHKHHTDISYLACAKALLSHADVIHAQFATHNAGTIAAVLQMAQNSGATFELQRLHGMGEAVYREVTKSRAIPVRIYAPVGEHRDLLAYLVRRLLENGANSSFINQLGDRTLSIDALLASPLAPAAAPALPMPVDLYRAENPPRANSMGLDIARLSERQALLSALAQAQRIEAVVEATKSDTNQAIQHLREGFARWSTTALQERAAALRRAADQLEARMPEFCALLVLEGRKTWGDGVAEVREAVDYCRYYAGQAEHQLAPRILAGPTGESNELRLRARGVFVCISPWNFPLAIFTGQIVAALVAGNTVAAKPAEQTPAIAARMVALLHEAGIPHNALALLHGPGHVIGAALVADARIAGVCFTGSTAVARTINRALAAKDGPIVPLIAETGGINAMVVDSTALPEQVVDAVVQSAFRSAGQRCSALRLLCVHSAIADSVIDMIRGALEQLRVGDPALPSTDVGPVIDDAAVRSLHAHIDRLRRSAKLIGESPLDPDAVIERLVAPAAFEMASISELKEEIFGPVLHVVRWNGDIDVVIEEINALGYGLTLGLQTRIDSRALKLAEVARVGNVYVNRNMVGAVVGVQPFGGEGLSGTGPKAGGPNYLPRFCVEQTLTINTAAIGGNVELLARTAHVQRPEPDKEL